MLFVLCFLQRLFSRTLLVYHQRKKTLMWVALISGNSFLTTIEIPLQCSTWPTYRSRWCCWNVSLPWQRWRQIHYRCQPWNWRWSCCRCVDKTKSQCPLCSLLNLLPLSAHEFRLSRRFKSITDIKQYIDTVNKISILAIVDHFGLTKNSNMSPGQISHETILPQPHFELTSLHVLLLYDCSTLI